jgi:hypothetical protein
LDFTRSRKERVFLSVGWGILAIGKNGRPAMFPLALAAPSCHHPLPSRNDYLELTMPAYIPALIWSLSSVACLIIAKRRHVKKTALGTALAALLGPVAIPFIIAAKSQKFEQA